MKRVVLLMIAVLILARPAFGATSEDLSPYVRKDVFEVYMQNINANTERILEELRSQRQEISALVQKTTDLEKSVSVLSARIDGLDARLSARIDGLEGRLSARIDGLDARVGDLRNDIYLGLVILGIIVSLPVVQKMLQSREKHQASSHSYVTLEDVKQLIEQNNAKLQQKFQA